MLRKISGEAKDQSIRFYHLSSSSSWARVLD